MLVATIVYSVLVIAYKAGAISTCDEVSYMPSWMDLVHTSYRIYTKQLRMCFMPEVI